MGIEETGPTALGPAVITSVALVCKGNPGSTVVICTDGLSNTGLGAFDEAKSEQEKLKMDNHCYKLDPLFIQIYLLRNTFI